MASSRQAVTAMRRGQQPAYRQIARHLRNRIMSGAFGPDLRLPTEDDLMAEFGVSRHTVRAALSVLVAEGLVERYAGRGSFVVERSPQPAGWRIRSLDDIVNEPFPADPELLEAAWVDCGTEPEATDELDLDPFDEMLRITALRQGPEGPIACSQIFLPSRIGRRILDDVKGQLSRQPIVWLIEKRLGLSAHRAVQVATLRHPPAIVAEALQEPADRMTIALLRTYTTRDGQPFEYSRLYGKPDRFSNTIEFSRLQTEPNDD